MRSRRPGARRARADECSVDSERAFPERSNRKVKARKARCRMCGGVRECQYRGNLQGKSDA